MILPREIYLQLLDLAYAEAPLECCGYLAGEGDVVIRIYPMKNVDQSRVHYSFDPKEQFGAVKEIRKQKLQVLAVYHSHPEAPARPSVEDIRLAFDPGVRHVIVSLSGGGEDVRVFWIKNGQVVPEELKIV